MILTNRYSDGICQRLVLAATASYTIVACSSVATQAITRDQIIAAVRQEVQTREPNSAPLRNSNIYGVQPGGSGEPERSGKWRVWVFPVSHPIGDGDTGYQIEVEDGGRELVFNRAGALLSYKRMDASPDWLRPRNG